MEEKAVISSVAIALLIGLGIGSVFFPLGAPTNTVIDTHTVTYTYTVIDTSGAWLVLVSHANQSSTSAVTTYYMVCIFTEVYGASNTGPTTSSHPTTWFVPWGTISSTSVAATTSSAPPGHVVTVSGTNETCTYVSTVSLP